MFQGLWAEGAGDVSVAMQGGRTASLPGCPPRVCVVGEIAKIPLPSVSHSPIPWLVNQTSI